MKYLAAVFSIVVLLTTAPVTMAGTVSYTYDALGRLTGVDYAQGAMSASLVYSYDKAGNILVTTVDASAPGGDVNFDGEVDLVDAILILRLLSGHHTPEMNPAADIDADQHIGISEAIYTIMQAAAE
jgi:hypothetical protein